MYRNSRRKASNHEAGFSLVELMVAVFIMGLLATLVIVNVAPVGGQSRVTKANADIAALESALEMYSLDMQGYPSTEEGLAALKSAPANADSRFRAGGYIKRVQKDPWGNEYGYSVPGVRSGTAFDLFSAGPDGIANTEDDIGNWGDL
jgi:general secretion pathway protein G